MIKYFLLMASLALFFHQSAGITQSTNKSYGIDTANVNKFRVSSIFNITGSVQAYAMVSGTILLQQQDGVPSKVNLILRPHNQDNLKLGVKYIVYRGLQTSNFIANNNLTDPSNKVNTSGSELLDAIQAIQQQRAPADDVSIESLFGNELAPLNTKNIDEFFFKNLATTSQLFTIECGIGLGNFATGEVSIEVILENPEYTLTVEDAKKVIHEINVTGFANAEKKWKQDLVRHFVDPAAYYGLHHDIKGGIEYRNASGKQYANTAELVYSQIVDKFLTKNKVYLDVRNENGYSYNYYGNYLGTGVDAEKNIRIGQTEASMVAKEYYTNDWAIHTIGVTAGSGTENEIFFALRINDNDRPLLAGWNYELINTSGLGSIASDKNVYFADEVVLLPNTVSDFTNVVSFKVPNISGSTAAQLATIVKLDYIKQLIPLTSTNIFPKQNFLDYIFGPLDVTIPWDSDDAVQWFTNNNRPYIDALHNGFVLGKYKTTILSINTTEKEIEIYDEVPVDLSHPVIIENSTPNSGNVGSYTPTGVRFLANKTFIKVKEGIPLPLQTGDQLTLVVKLDGKLDTGSNKFIFENKNITNLEVLSANNQLDFYNVFSFSNSFTIASAVFVSPNTEITFTDSKSQSGFSGFVETGAIVETDQSITPPLDNDRLVFYAAPSNYFSSNGISKSSGFNSSGGVLKYDSILKALEAMMPGIQIKKDNLMIGTENILTFSYSSQSKAKQALFLLGLTKPEWESAKTASASLIGIHNRLFKLNGEGKTKTDKNGTSYYEYQLMVAGLESSGTFQEVNTGINIYTTDHIIFGSKNFAAKYGIDVTQAEIALNNFINETLGINGGLGNGIILDKLNTTKEEINNLQYRNFWTISPGEANKKLFALDPTMKDKITQFKLALDTLQDDYNSVKTIIETKGADLLKYAKQRIKEQAKDYTNKDGILYLTRLIMQVVLKNHPKLLTKFPSKITELSDLFEKHSRGLEGTEKPVFLPQTATNFNILISGFDPFSGGQDWDDYISNPSGNIALALDGEIIPGTGGSTKKATVKSGVFPVRFTEFDNGWIEKFFEPYVSDVNVKLIVTFSYGFSEMYNSQYSNSYFNIDRMASNFRASIPDNNNYTPPSGKIISHSESAFIENALGKFSSITNKHNDYSEWISLSTQFYLNQTYEGTIDGKDILGDELPTKTVMGTMVDDNYSTLTIFPDKNDPNFETAYKSDREIIASRGSGGTYLSNEIHYRVSFLRYGTAKRTGHIHVGFLKKNKDGELPTNRETMLDVIKLTLSEIIKNF